MNNPAVAEIGSEFWSVPQTVAQTDLFPDNTAWFQSGRSALACILDELLVRHHIRSAALPSWCCDSMILPFLERRIDVQFYPVYVDRDGMLVQDYRSLQTDMTLVMEYFGYHSRTLSQPCGVVIRDVTHSLLTDYNESPPDDDTAYRFGSLRKWCGVYTGGFAWSKDPSAFPADAQPVDEQYISLRKAAMHQKKQYIDGASSDRSYLSVFAQAEERLDRSDRHGADPRDIEAARHLDVPSVIKRRRENASILLNAVSSLAIFPEIGETECPLFVPIRVPHGRRDALRAHLIEQKIFCPVHWPVSEYHSLTEQTADIYRQELSLVCDQRYTAQDMERFAEQLLRFL